MRKRIWYLFLLVGSIVVGCDEQDAPAQGTLSLELWGEKFIETEIPAVEFEDGYGIEYRKFLVSLSAVTAAQNDTAEQQASFDEQRVWDVSQPGPFAIGSADVDAGSYENAGYAILKTTAHATPGNASIEDVQLMKNNGYSVYVEGIATLGTNSWTFAWGFDTETVYGPCHSKGEVREDSGGSIQVTIHGDHLFYDSAVSETPSLRFGDLASADVDEDGIITQMELLQYPLAPLAYYIAPSGSGIENMWTYLAHMTTTLGHIDGEGHCETH